MKYESDTRQIKTKDIFRLCFLKNTQTATPTLNKDNAYCICKLKEVDLNKSTHSGFGFSETSIFKICKIPKVTTPRSSVSIPLSLANPQSCDPEKVVSSKVIYLLNISRKI